MLRYSLTNLCSIVIVSIGLLACKPNPQNKRTSDSLATAGNSPESSAAEAKSAQEILDELLGEDGLQLSKYQVDIGDELNCRFLNSADSSNLNTKITISWLLNGQTLESETNDLIVISSSQFNGGEAIGCKLTVEVGEARAEALATEAIVLSSNTSQTELTPGIFLQQKTVASERINRLKIGSNGSFYGVGEGGNVVISIDDGLTWQRRYLGSDLALSHISFFDNMNGFAGATAEQWFNTNDGGISWTPVVVPELDDVPTQRCGAVHATDATSALYGCSNPGEPNSVVGLRRTSDRGQTFATINLRPDINHTINKIKFIGQAGWVGGNRMQARTENGGLSWIVQDVTDNRSVFDFADATNGLTTQFIPGKGTSVQRSTTAGGQWIEVASLDDLRVSEIAYPDLNNAFIGNDAGEVMYSRNQGTTWTAIKVSDEEITSLAFKDSNVGIASDACGRLFKTTDAGNSWNQVSSGTCANLRGIAFDPDNSLRGISVGENGTIHVTYDQGRNWFTRNADSTVQFNSAAAFKDKFIVVGDAGSILTSDNSSYKWQSRVSNTASNLNDIKMFDDKIGWIVGDQGTILQTKNSGSSWSIQNINTDSDLQFIEVVSDQILWTGGDRQLFKSSDGGASWLEVALPDVNLVRAGCFIDENTGYVVSATTIRFTNDSGQNWQTQPVTDGAGVALDVDCRAATNALLAGSLGLTKDYTNIEASSLVTTTLHANLNSVWSSDTVSFMAGNDGIIVRIDH